VVVEPGWCGRWISASSDNGVHGFEVRVWGLEVIHRRWFRGGRVGAAVSTAVGGGVAVRVPPRPRAAGGAGGSGLPRRRRSGHRRRRRWSRRPDKERHGREEDDACGRSSP
jgi:hypothetical protein